ncbi:MAG: LacI family DNA-binding transcriptional regulator, partial [Phycisphaeraceae bacterium]|nr:LacI family DNA-binding transcriptional regulator [Phycisphaeraceae bacterium]
ELAQTFKPLNVVIAYNTELATHITHLALSMGYRVGHDFGLVCCEDSANAHDNWPGLSRVSFDRYHMGKIAADMLLNLLNRPKEQSLPSQVLPVHWLPGNTAWGPRGH